MISELIMALGESINLHSIDVHEVAGLIKMYFRELPTPLFTYELYVPHILLIMILTLALDMTVL